MFSSLGSDLSFQRAIEFLSDGRNKIPDHFNPFSTNVPLMDKPGD